MSNSIVQVPFHGDTLEAVKTEDGKILVHFKRLCEALGLDYKTQHRKLTAEDCDWSTMVIMTTVAEDGKQRQLTMIEHESVPMWLVTISPNKVNPAIREKLRLYRREAKAVLAAWFLGSSSDIPALAREFAEAKKRMNKVEAALNERRHRLLELSMENAELENELDMSRPASFALGEAGDADYMTLREYCDRFKVKVMGRAILGRELRVYSRNVAGISRALRVEVKKADDATWGEVNSYRFDILRAWHYKHDMDRMLPNDKYKQLMLKSFV